MTALAKLRACLDRLDSYGAPSDASSVFIDEENCTFELLEGEEEEDKQLTLGDLRLVLCEAENLL